MQLPTHLQVRWPPIRSRLFDRELEAEVAELRLRLEVARMRKHRHDLVNAFTAVEGAATLLAQDTLDPADRNRLGGMLGSGLRRLHGLLLEGPDEHHASLAVVAASLADDPAWQGRVGVDVAADLVVTGAPSEIAEAVRQVLTLANQRAPWGPLRLRADRSGDRIELWVEDRGPRIAARERRRVLDPDRRPSFGSDTVHPLDVAVRLARGQGGDLRVQPRPGGGASFGFSWMARSG